MRMRLQQLGAPCSAGQGQLTEAMECYRPVSRINLKHADAHNNLGLNAIRLDEQGQRAEAIECYQQACGINPEHATMQL